MKNVPAFVLVGAIIFGITTSASADWQASSPGGLGSSHQTGGKSYAGPGPNGSWGANFDVKRRNIEAAVRDVFKSITAAISQSLDSLARQSNNTMTAVNRSLHTPSWHDYDNGGASDGYQEFGDHDNMPSGCPHC